MNVAKLFRTWFQWGIFSIVTVMLVGRMASSQSAMKSLGSFAEINMLSVVIITLLNAGCWIICGAYWRFSEIGQVAAGPLPFEMQMSYYEEV